MNSRQDNITLAADSPRAVCILSAAADRPREVLEQFLHQSGGLPFSATQAQEHSLLLDSRWLPWHSRVTPLREFSGLELVPSSRVTGLSVKAT
jgi:hypothetical protein